MLRIGKRLTYANVVSSIALFLVLSGGAAYAASHLAKNSVGTKQLKRNAVTSTKIKKNAVTSDKVKNGSLTGADIDVATLGTVPSAASLSGRTSFQFFAPAGVKDVAALGPFTIRANCEINKTVGASQLDIAELQLLTSVDEAAMDDNNGEELAPFNIVDSPAEILGESGLTGTPLIETDDGHLVAVAPDGTVVTSEDHAVGVNIAGHKGQCFFSGTFFKRG